VLSWESRPRGVALASDTVLCSLGKVAGCRCAGESFEWLLRCSPLLSAAQVGA